MGQFIGRSWKQAFTVMVGVLALAGCAPSSGIRFDPGEPLVTIRRVAFEPTRDAVAEPLVSNLRLQGFTVLAPNDTAGLIQKLNVSAAKLFEPDNLRRLNGESVDVVMSLRTIVGNDGTILVIQLQAVNTSSGRLFGRWNWENPGRISVDQAATQLGREVGARLRSF